MVKLLVILAIVSLIFPSSGITSRTFAQLNSTIDDPNQYPNNSKGILLNDSIPAPSNSNTSSLNSTIESFPSSLLNSTVEPIGNNNSIKDQKFKFTLSNGAVINTRLQIIPNANYSITLFETEEANKIGNSVYGFKINHSVSNVTKMANSSVEYYVPYSALDPDLVMLLETASSTKSPSNSTTPIDSAPLINSVFQRVSYEQSNPKLTPIADITGETLIAGVKLDTWGDVGDYGTAIVMLAIIAKNLAEYDKILDELIVLLDNPNCNVDEATKYKIIREIERARSDIKGNSYVQVGMELMGTVLPFGVPTLLSKVFPNFDDYSKKEVQRVKDIIGKFSKLKGTLDFSGYYPDPTGKHGLFDSVNHLELTFGKQKGDELIRTSRGPVEKFTVHGEGTLDGYLTGSSFPFTTSGKKPETVDGTAEYDIQTKQLKIIFNLDPNSMIYQPVTVRGEGSQYGVVILNVFSYYLAEGKYFPIDLSKPDIEGNFVVKDSKTLSPIKIPTDFKMSYDYKLVISPKVCGK